jgi:hypothetical protein
VRSTQRLAIDTPTGSTMFRLNQKPSNYARLYVDTIFRMTQMYPNFEPEVCDTHSFNNGANLKPALQIEVRVGDFGTIDPSSGAFECTGNIYDHVVDQSIPAQGSNQPLPQPFQSNPSGLYQIITTAVTASSSEISTLVSHRTVIETQY